MGSPSLPQRTGRRVTRLAENGSAHLGRREVQGVEQSQCRRMRAVTFEHLEAPSTSNSR